METSFAPVTSAETVFPHSVSSFPKTRDWLDVNFEGVPPDVRHRVLVNNPWEFFRLDAADELSATPGA